MSGVVCVFSRDGSVVGAADVEAVLEHQTHRGPDGLRVWCQGPIGLGYAALDPTGAGIVVEPLVDDGGRLAIVGDLRIDNRQELVDGLDLSRGGAHDSEIVLAAYRRWGFDAPLHLEGAFVFVIWDAIRRRVFCARDHLGQKPLTYHLSRSFFICASEAEAVPCASAVPRRINETRIADYLVSELEGVDHTSTFFEGVVRLPPAHFLVVDRDGHQLRQYWQPDEETELRLDSDEAYAEAFSEVFSRAVESCLTDISAPALLLSGGLDSAAVAAFAGRLADVGKVSPPASCSFIDEEWDASPESACIRNMAGIFGAEELVLSPADVGRMASPSRMALFDCGEPFDSFMATPSLLYQGAAGRGSRVVLDGVDGDVVVSTSPPIDDLVKRLRIGHAWREVAAANRLFRESGGPIRRLAGGAFRAWAPGVVRHFVETLREGRQSEDPLRQSLVDRDFARQIGLTDRLAMLSGHGWGRSAGSSRAVHARTLTHPYIAAALERYDRVAARRGVEARHPFFDLRLVEFCLSLPWDLKVRRGWTKFALRSATGGVVPDELRWRHDFGDMLWRANARVMSEEKGVLNTELQECGGLIARYVDLTKLEQARDALGGNPTDDEEVWIWQLVTLSRWLRRYNL